MKYVNKKKKNRNCIEYYVRASNSDNTKFKKYSYTYIFVYIIKVKNDKKF